MRRAFPVYDLQTRAFVCRLLSIYGPYCFFSLLFHPCCTLLYSDDGKRHWQSSQRTTSTHLQQLPDANSRVKIEDILVQSLHIWISFSDKTKWLYETGVQNENMNNTGQHYNDSDNSITFQGLGICRDTNPD